MKAEYIAHLGSDLTVVNAARVSFDKESEWELGEPREDAQGVYVPDVLSSRDVKLIGYLATHNHFTPFTHCIITLRETVPIFVARQRFKHQVGFTYNEVSRRYVDDVPEFFFPTKWREKADNKKQGSGEDHPDSTIISGYYLEFIREAEEFYDYLITNGVAPEQARMVLPQSMYTSYYCTGSLAAFARAYKLRTDEHAQLEIQDLASQWDKIIRPLYPVSWSSLVD